MRAGFSFLAAGLLISGSVLAGPVPGRYELYDGQGQRAGTVAVTITTAAVNGFVETKIESVTDISVKNMLGKYSFHEKGEAVVGPKGVLRFVRETEEDGKKALIVGERRDKEMFVNAKKNGKSLGFTVPLHTFDVTEFETDLPGRGFNLMKAGERKTLRVFFLDLLKVMPAARDVSMLDDVVFDEKEISVLSARTTANGKTVTSWFDVKTGKLLQEQGDDFLISRQGD